MSSTGVNIFFSETQNHGRHYLDMLTGPIGITGYQVASIIDAVGIAKNIDLSTSGVAELKDDRGYLLGIDVSLTSSQREAIMPVLSQIFKKS